VPAPLPPGSPSLAPVEKRLLELAAEGLTRQEISAVTGWHPEVIHDRWTVLFNKLEPFGVARKQTAVIAFCLRHGLLE